MGRRINEYEIVETLPAGAITVGAYANKLGVSKQAIYNQVRRKKNNNFKIIEFQKINFIVLIQEKSIA